MTSRKFVVGIFAAFVLLVALVATASAQVRRVPFPLGCGPHDMLCAGAQDEAPAAAEAPETEMIFSGAVNGVQHTITSGGGLTIDYSFNHPATKDPISDTCLSTAKLCYAKVSLKGQFDGLTPLDGINTIAAALYVDGSTDNAWPANPVGIDSTSTGNNTHEATWTVGSITPGPHKFQVFLYCAVSGCGAASYSRTFEVQMYKQK